MRGSAVRAHWLMLRKTFRVTRAWNALKIGLSYGISVLLRRPVVWGLPPTVMIEPTNVCNLRCPLCPTGAGTLGRPGRFMPFDTYCAVIDELQQSAVVVLLWNQGESFMHPQFLPMVRYASDRALWTWASTNGHFLPDPDAVVRSGLGTLVVSLDGASQATYEAYRRGGDFAKVVEGLRALAAAKRRLRSATPLIHLQFIVMRHNEHEVPTIASLAAQWGVDRLTVKTAMIYDDADIGVWLPRDPRHRRYRVVPGADGRPHFAMKHGYKNRCKRLWAQPVVNAGGEIAVCCFDKDVDFPMGAVPDGSFRQAWTSERFRAFRQSILLNRSRYEMCRNCGEGVKLNVARRDVPLPDSSRRRRPATDQTPPPDDRPTPEVDPDVARAIETAARSRERPGGSRPARRAGRTGVAGMSLGQGPRPIEDLRPRRTVLGRLASWRGRWR